jgi:protease-4
VKKRTAWVLVAGVAAMALGAAAVGVLALVLRGQSGPSWSGNRYLFLDLSEEIPEQPPSELGSFFERRPPSLRTLVESIDRAASDPKVTALVLRVGFLPDAGWGKVQELRDAVARFRGRGKPAYAYLEFCGNKEYYLATAADKIYALPTALLDVTGLAAEVTFLRRTLDKVGVQAQFEGVGKYKNAPNQYTETGFTEPHREQMDALLDSFYGQYLKGIAEGRARTVEEVSELVDAGPYDGPTAKEAGLVDELLYEDELEKKIESSGRVTPGRYVRSASGGFGFDRRPKLALIYAVGEIVSGDSRSGPFGGEGAAGSDTVSAAIRRARDDDDIRAIVLRVDSPGGSGTASDVIWREVVQARKRKPVVVSMGDYAASGGYYISMGSDAIVAQPGTLTGSIGVFGGKFSLRGLYDKIGVTKEILTRGDNAAFFTEYRPWSEEERARVRSLMETFYRDFVKKVADSRDKSFEEADALAQGRVWTGAEAHRHGLVDHLGGFDVALSVAKQKAGIGKDQDVTLVVLPERKGLLETLLERQDEAIVGALPRDLQGVVRLLSLLAKGEPLARLPFEVSIR